MKTKNAEVKRRSLWGDALHRLLKNKGATISGIFLIFLLILGLLGNVIFDYETQVVGQDMMQRLLPPSLEHPFGTDNMGRDLFIRVIYGARYTLPVSLISTIISLIIGVILGGFAGFFGGRIDQIIMRFVDIWSALPNMLLGILLVSVMGIGLVPLTLALGLSSFAIFTRITRSSVISKGSVEYAEAARAIGARDIEILFQHTKALLSAIPIPDLRNKRERILLKGEVTSPINPPECCRFCTRCYDMENDCSGRKEPQLVELPGNHFVACHKYCKG